MNLRDHRGRTPIHLFLSGKWPWSEAGKCIQLLIATGADLSAKDEQGKTPLHYLAALGSQNPMFFISNIGEMFSAAKVDIQAHDNKGDAPVHVAARTGTQDVFEWLVKQGANLDETNGIGETPRSLAARSTEPFARFRFNSKTDILQAVREGKTESVTALLREDPKLLNQTNQFGQSPLLVAVIMHRTNMVELLNRRGARWDAVSAVIAGRIDKLREILAADPAAATSTCFGQGLLHLAAARGDIEITRTLVNAHCSLRAQDAMGLSPLGDALLQKRTEVVALLRQHGAAENIFDAVYTDRRFCSCEDSSFEGRVPRLRHQRDRHIAR